MIITTLTGKLLGEGNINAGIIPPLFHSSTIMGNLSKFVWCNIKMSFKMLQPKQDQKVFCIKYVGQGECRSLFG